MQASGKTWLVYENGTSEIGEFRLPVVTYEDVFRLDVGMNYSGAMTKLQSTSYRSPRCQSFVARQTKPIQTVLQRRAAQLHRYHRPDCTLLDREDSHYVRVTQKCSVSLRVDRCVTALPSSDYLRRYLVTWRRRNFINKCAKNFRNF